VDVAARDGASGLEMADETDARYLRFWLFVDGRPVACVVEVDERGQD
jgi:hypothetical protein